MASGGEDYPDHPDSPLAQVCCALTHTLDAIRGGEPSSQLPCGAERARPERSRGWQRELEHKHKER
jgi:hypothetical protein